MIHFVCKHCGRFLQAADSAIVKEKRCPLCNGLVRVPARSKHLAQSGNATPVSSMGSNGPTGATQVSTAAPEEMELSTQASRSAEETDIMPAIRAQGALRQQEPLWKRHFRRLAEAQAKAHRTRRSWHGPVVACTLLLAALIVLVLVTWALLTARS